MILDLGAILAGLGSIIAAVAALSARRSAKATNRTLTTNNGGSTVKDQQEAAWALILDGQRSLGHQVGEIRTDMGRMDERLTSEVAGLREKIG